MVRRLILPVVGLLLGGLAGPRPGAGQAREVVRVATLKLVGSAPLLWAEDRGIGEPSKVAVIAIGAFFPVAIGSMGAVREVDPLLVRAALNLGATPLQVVTKVRLPASVPAIFASLRLAAGMALLLVVSAEMIAASAGIGYLILYAGDLMQMARLLAGIAVLSVLGLLSTAGLKAAETRLARGRERT